MIHALLSDAARCSGAQHIGADVNFTGIEIDSRHIKPGSLFVAIRGARHDGHDFIHHAKTQGATAALVSKPIPSSSLPLLITHDPVDTLGVLACAWRRHFQLPVIAVLGSNGKTTVKELIASILRQQHGESILATQGNQNNAIGLPLTLFKLNERHHAAVLELGANKAGEIRQLGKIAQPNLAVITNAGLDHIAGFGGVEGAAHANGEIFSSLSTSGIAILNGDDDCLAIWRHQAASQTCLTFGFNAAVDVRGHWSPGCESNSLTIDSSWGRIETQLHLPGKHNAMNALAAAAACLSLGVEPDAIQIGLESARPVKGRFQHRLSLGGIHIYDDSYNANPSSLEVALETLSGLPGKRILVMGDMAELGDESEAWHSWAGTKARSMGINALFTFGDLATHAALKFGAGAQHFDHQTELVKALIPCLDDQVTVLIKGSRAMAMENIVSELVSIISPNTLSCD